LLRILALLCAVAAVLARRAKAVVEPTPRGLPWGNMLDFPYSLHDAVLHRWLVGLLLAQVVLQFLLLPRVRLLKEKPGAMAHQLVICVPFVYAALVGGAMWLGDEGIAAAHASDYQARLYGANAGSWLLIRFMVAFSLYDLLATALVPDLRKAEHIAHHVATLLTALAGAAAGGPFFTCGRRTDNSSLSKPSTSLPTRLAVTTRPSSSASPRSPRSHSSSSTCFGRARH
jgi:hypothetical protein